MAQPPAADRFSTSLRGRLHCFLVCISQILPLAILCVASGAAEISTSHYKRLDGKSACRILIKGTIATGDSGAFKDAALQCIKADHSVGIVDLQSLGGNFIEALSIGEQVQTLAATTRAPRIGRRGEEQLDTKKWNCHSDQCVCASACFFVWISGAHRLGDALVIHRPFIEANIYRNIS